MIRVVGPYEWKKNCRNALGLGVKRDNDEAGSAPGAARRTECETSLVSPPITTPKQHNDSRAAERDPSGHRLSTLHHHHLFECCDQATAWVRQ